MKKLTFSILAFLLIYGVHAQQVVMLHSSGTSTMFSGNTSLEDAFDAAATGDTLYLSGGGFDLPNPFSKGLKIFGAGMHPDSTDVTNQTLLNNELRIANGADGLHIEGVILNGKVRKGYTNVVDDVSFVRCLFEDEIDLGYGGAPSNPSSGYSFLQCVFREMLNPDGVNNALVSHCILEDELNGLNSGTVQNCSFMHEAPSSSAYDHVIRESDNNSFFNNIFHGATRYIMYSGVSNTFRNNVFVASDPKMGTTPVDLDNYKNIDLSTVFVTVPGYTFDFTDDLHLQSSAQSTYLGTDNTQVGVYGGMFPMKEGFVPQNPHTSSHQVSSTTDQNGNLQVNITIVAQPD